MKKTTWVEPILFGYMFCLFTTMPLEQQLIYKKTCIQTFNTSYCEVLYKSKNEIYKEDQDFIQKSTSQWEIYFNIARTAPAISSTLIYTAWFDRVGRKKIMLMPMIGGALLSVSLIINSHFMTWPVEVMMIGTFLEGLFGQFAAVLAAVFSYVADVTSVSFRTKRTIILESMSFLGSIMANTIGGILVQNYGFLAAFILLFAMYAFQIIYWTFLKESYPPKVGDGKGPSLLSIIKVKLFIQAFQVMVKKRENGKRKTILLLMACFICFTLFFVGFTSISVLYILHPPINFLPSSIGYFFAETNALKFVGASFINFVFLHKMGWSDNRVMMIFCVSQVGFSLSLAFSDTTWKVYTSAIWGLGLGVGAATVRGRLSKLVGPDEQGKLFSLMACLELLCSFLAGVVFNAIYKQIVDISPNIIFFIFAGLDIIPILLVIALMKWGTNEEYSQLEEEKEIEGENIPVNS